MSGRIDFFSHIIGPIWQVGSIVLISLIGAGTDLKSGRIYNWLTLPSLLLGLIYSFSTHGLSGFADAILGVIVAFVLYSPLFWLGMMGGGDVKLLMALAAWGGLHYTVEVALLGVMVGGAVALLVLVFEGKIIDFSKRLHHFLLTLTVRELEPEAPRVDKSSTMPFGPALAFAAIWVAVRGGWL